MKIFLSHSATDRPLVQALRKLIIDAHVESIEIAYSTATVLEGGIGAGQDWLGWIYDQVKSSALTIVVLTPLSKARPWLMWEAGAASGAGIVRGSSAYVVPLLFGMRQDQVPSPLASRQTKIGTEKRDIEDLIESIRKLGGLTYVSESKLSKALESYISVVSQEKVPGMHDVFISCPMTSVDSLEYEELKSTAYAIGREISSRGRSYYSAIERIDTNQPDQEDIAAELDFPALISSRHFIMIYPKRLISSCVVEAGYALGAGIQSTYFVRIDEDLPYALRGALGSFSDVRRVRFKAYSEIVEFIAKHPERILGN